MGKLITLNVMDADDISIEESVIAISVQCNSTISMIADEYREYVV